LTVSPASNRIREMLIQKRLVIAVLAIAIFTAQNARAEVIERTSKIRGTTVHFKVVLPNGYDPAKSYPAVIALGGGSQNMSTVDGVLTRYFRAEAEKRGYIVIGLAAPDDQLVLWVGADIFPEFFKQILSDYKIEGGKFHIGGPSNGGIAALEIAAAHPQYFRSVTAFPGYMEEPLAPKLKAISKMCVFMYVGEFDDHGWQDDMKSEVDFLTSIGAVARYTVEKGQPHGIQTLAGANAGRLFDGFEGCTVGAGFMPARPNEVRLRLE
jgi:poly(3-hydroxybutyrate) depolymerase